MKFKDFLAGKKTRWILPAAVAAVVVAVVVLAGNNMAAAAAAEAKQQAVTKDVAVQKGDITVGVTETGTASVDSQTITSDLAGAVIDQVLVKAGQSVKKGDAIATLTKESVDTAVQTLQLSYNQAVNKQKQAESALTSGKTNAKTTLNTNQAKGQNAQTTYNDAIQSLQDAVTSATNAYNSCTGTINYYNANMDSLKAKKDAADTDAAANPSDTAKQQAAQDADKAYTDAQNDLANQINQQPILENKMKAAQDALTSGKVTAQAQLDNDKATAGSASTVYNNTLASLQSDVDSANLAVTTAKQALDKVTPYQTDPTIYSAYDGLVESINYSAGATIAENNTAIANIALNTVAYMLVAVTQDDIANLTVGQSADVTLSSFTGQKFTGKIDSITITPARTASSTVSYSVTVKLDGDVSKIYQGMTGDITFVTKQVKDVLYVSNKAVTTSGGKSYVNVKDANGNVTKVQATTGFSDGTNVEIQSGLSEGQTVVITSQVVTQQ